MANAAQSSRQLHRRIAKSPFRGKGGVADEAKGEVRVRVAASAAPRAEDDGKDGLLWEVGKKRLTKAQAEEAMAYRKGFRDAGEVSVRSCLDVGVGGGQLSYLPGAAVLSMTAARRELFTARYKVLRGQVDMLTVMDGVCGLGHTLRHLAGGDRHRADELRVALKLALDMLVAYRAGPPASAGDSAD